MYVASQSNLIKFHDDFIAKEIVKPFKRRHPRITSDALRSFLTRPPYFRFSSYTKDHLRKGIFENRPHQPKIGYYSLIAHNLREGLYA